MNYDRFGNALQESMGAQIPQVLGALAIFIVGWLIAVIARAATLRVLAALKADERIRSSTGAEVTIAKPVSIGVFWLVMLVAVIAALNVLDLANLSGPFSMMLGDFIGYLPSLVAGAVLILIVLLIATVLRSAVTRILESTQLDEKLSAAAEMTPVSRSAGNVVFWLVILLFLPSILGALRLGGTLTPVRDMLTTMLGILPNIFAAALIGFVGWIIARVLRGLVVNLLVASGADTLPQRFGMEAEFRLSRLAGTVVFILVFVPSLIAALEALKIEAISGPATYMLGLLLNAVPHIIAAALILALTWFIARFVAQLAARLTESSGFDAVPARLGMGEVFSGAARPSRLVFVAVMFFSMLFATVEAADQLGFGQVRDVVTTFIAFAGDIVLGGLILVIGFWLANLAHDAIARSAGPNSAGLAPVARIAILGVVIAMGLRAMGIADEIVQLAFGLTLGAVAVAVALSFGLGGREAAGRVTEDWADRVLRKPKP